MDGRRTVRFTRPLPCGEKLDQTLAKIASGDIKHRQAEFFLTAVSLALSETIRDSLDAKSM